MTVFCVHQNNDDISDALRYGELRYVNARYVYPDEVDGERLPPAFVDNMRRAADEFDPATDFLLIQGDHLQLLAFAAELMYRHAYYKVLRYDRQEKAYYPVRIAPDILT